MLNQIQIEELRKQVEKERPPEKSFARKIEELRKSLLKKKLDEDEEYVEVASK